MSSISILLYEYLMREQHLVLPSIGEISLRYSSPELNLEQGIFHPRRYQYVFNADSEENSDKLESFIARKLGCKLSEAKEAIYSWVEKIQAHCSHTSHYKWLDIGEFANNKQNKLVFRPLQECFSFLQEVLFIRNMANVKKSDSKEYHSSSYTDERYDSESATPIANTEKKVGLTEEVSSPEAIVESPIRENSNKQAVELNPVESQPVKVVDSKVKEADFKPSTTKLGDKGSKVYTEFVELDAPERYGILHKVFVIILILAGFLYIFLHLFLNDFSFHSYVR